MGVLTDQQQIFGDQSSPMKTHIVTLAKYIIYEARRAERSPSFAHFQRCLGRDIETERFFARETLTVEKFNKTRSGLKCVMPL